MAMDLYFIVDGSGNYYRVNSADQLVAVESREYAGVFNFAEANQKIGGGKKAHFYSVIPVEEKDELEQEILDTAEPLQKEQEVAVKKDCELIYDMKQIDWEEYLTHFCYLASSVRDYQEELKKAQSDVDMQICDIMHYIELYDLDESESIRMVELLKECREQRRDVKDEMVRVESFQKAIGTSSNIAKAKDSVKQMKKLSTRKYNARKLPALFNGCMDETVRKSKLTRAMDDTTCMDEIAYSNIQDVSETDDMPMMAVEEGVMEYTKRITVFDGQENNWLAFAEQQAEFYANAEQYIINLQIRQGELEEELEKILEEVEHANYNVTQGYNVYKRLKELRNAKKNLQTELEALYILTYGTNCAQVADNMTACVNELKELYGDQINEEAVGEKPASEEMLSEIILAG